jgi:hypothetical protein
MDKFFGYERRKGERRHDLGPRAGSPSEYWSAGGMERRVSPERRQEDLAGVIVNFSDKDMENLVKVWQALEILEALNE